MGVNNLSVSMCVYHKDDLQWFREAVESILHQTVTADELVIVVDGPVPDALDKQICAFEAIDIVKVIRLPQNMGHGVARRIGLENCTNAFVALMDADDISLPDRFARQIALFQRYPELSIVGGQIAEFIGDINNVVGYRRVRTNDSEIRADLRKRCPMNQMTVMFRKEDVLAAGGYLDWYCNEDYYLWIRMYQKEMKFANTDSVLVNVRIGEDMYKRRGGWKYFASEWRLQNYMLAHRMIDPVTYCINVAKRLVVQVLLPNQIRGYVFQKFARKKDVQ